MQPILRDERAASLSTSLVTRVLKSSRVARAPTPGLQADAQKGGGRAAAWRARVPRDHPGADWRDLPNEALVLPDGVRVDALAYLGAYGGGRAGAAAAAVAAVAADTATGVGAGGHRATAPPSHLRRAACACHLPETQEERLRLRRTPGVCKAFERSRLVPFVCVHTADTNNGWKGAYGRLWLGACGGALLTTLALPSKGGAYIHPRQQRLYSAREAARLQGFGDGFRLGVDEAVVAAAARVGARAGAAGGGRLEAVAEEDEDGEGEEEEVEARGGHDSGGGGGSVAAAILTALHAVGNAVPPPFGAALARAMTRSAEGAALLGR